MDNGYSKLFWDMLLVAPMLHLRHLHLLKCALIEVLNFTCLIHGLTKASGKPFPYQS